MTKELLAAILDSEYKERVVEVITIEDDMLRTYYDCGSGSPTCLGLEYSLYELFFKCKEYVEKNTLDVIVIQNKEVYLGDGLLTEGGFYYRKLFTERSLIESMFACGQYILSKSAL